MIGLVVASHGGLARELVETAEGIIGDLPNVVATGISAENDSAACRARVNEAVHQVDDGAGVLVLADLLGGSPCVQSLALCRTVHIEVVSGVNLPMVLKAVSLRRAVNDLHELAIQIADYGRRTIDVASDTLREKLPTT